MHWRVPEIERAKNAAGIQEKDANEAVHAAKKKKKNNVRQINNGNRTPNSKYDEIQLPNLFATKLEKFANLIWH